MNEMESGIGVGGEIADKLLPFGGSDVWVGAIFPIFSALQWIFLGPTVEPYRPGVSTGPPTREAILSRPISICSSEKKGKESKKKTTMSGIRKELNN
jgi:hypothetical protein